MKNYLHCLVKRRDYSIFVNELKLNEVHLIKTLAKENKSVKVEYRQCTEEQYKSIFG